MAANGPQIIKDFDRAVNAAGNHRDRWERMAPYLAPSRVGITSKRSPGDSQMRGVYDSTSLSAAGLCASFLAGNLFNPGQLWIEYYMQNSIYRNDEIQEWLDECRDRSLRNLSASTFYAEAAESLVDWVGFGTDCLIGEENAQTHETKRGFRGFDWRAVKTGRFYILEGPNGQIDTVYEEWEATAELVKKLWFSDPSAPTTGSMPESMKTAVGSDREKKFRLVHGIYPRPKSERGYGNLGMPWASCWVDYESKTILHESGAHQPPTVSRYDKTPGEVFGRGRGDIAFPDVFTLNSAKRMGFEDWALKIRPPILHGHNAVIGSLQLVPGGPTAVNTHGRDIRTQIMPFETGSKPEISQIKEEELRASINTIFFIQHILKLMETEKSEMSAFEFSRKLALLYQLLGPVYGRAHYEKLYRIGETVWDLQYHAGVFSPPPPEIEDTDGQIAIGFNNPIAKAQRSGDTEALQLALADLAPMAQAGLTEVLDIFDPDKSAEMVVEVRGVPARVTRSKKEREAIRAARAEQNQAELQNQDMLEKSEAIRNATPALALASGKQK